MASVTWLGHGSFRLDTSDGKRVYVDPWLSGPTTPDSEKEPERADVIAVTHGHGDHVADVRVDPPENRSNGAWHDRAHGLAHEERRP